MAFVRMTLLGLLAGAAGFALALWWLKSEPASAPAPAPPTPPAAMSLRQDPALQSALVALQLRDSGQDQWPRPAPETSGIVVGNRGWIIADAAAVAGAGRVTIVTDSGAMVPADTVVASDDNSGLVALKATAALADVAVLRPADTSLRLDDQLALITAAGVGATRISSAARRDELGTYYYEIDRAVPQAGLSALIDTRNGALVGVVAVRRPGDGADAETRSVALDSQAITRLLATADRQGPLTLEQYSEYYFGNTSRGRLALLESLLLRGRHADAIELGREIVYLDDYLQQRVPALVRAALDARVRELIDAGRHGEAVDLIDATAAWIDTGTAVQALKAQLLAAMNRHAAALESLLAMRPPALERARQLVLEYAQSGRGGDTGVAMIRRALEADPDFAPYHRLLGEHYSRINDIPAAISSFEYAANLDATMALELTPVLARLKARRHTPPVAEIPIHRNDGVLMVETRINGSVQRFRFMLDTGASYTAISTATALRLGLENIFQGAPVVELQTANGRIYTTTARLDSVEIGNARVDNIEAVLLENSGRWDGLLGQSFLRHFDVEIDRSRGVIALHRRTSD